MRIRLALALATILMIPSFGLTSTSQAVTEAELSQIDQAIADLNTCLNSLADPVLDVFYLMDGSGSLANDGSRRGADPDGVRFQAVEESVAPLAELADAGVNVNVAAATFGNGASTVVPWTQVQPGDSGALAEELSSALENSFQRENTNWVAGLALAEEELAKKRLEKRSCQTLIWITDGGIFIENNAESNAAGIEAICGAFPTDFGSAKDQGSMFRLRNAGVVVLGFLLDDPNSDSQSRVSYFGPVVEGRGEVDSSYFGGENGQFACGRVIPGAAGAAIPAENPSALADALWAVSICITNRCITGDGFNEPLDRDEDGRWIMPITSGIATVLVRPRSDTVQIYDPNGTDVCAADADCTIENGALSISVLGNSGVWRLATGDNASPVVRFLLEISLTPEVPDDVISGEPTGVALQVVQADEPFRPELYDQVDLAWEFQSDDGSASSGVVGDSGLLVDFAPQAGGRLTLLLNAFVEATQVEGVTIPSLTVDVSQQVPLEVRPPGDYPSVIGRDGSSPETVLFPLIEGVGDATAVIRVQGPATGEGLVCLAPVVIESDPGVAEVGRTLAFSSDFDCASGQRTISAGEIIEIPITASTDRQFSGVARGQFFVQLQPVDGGRVFPEAIDFEVPSTLQRSSGAALITFIVMTILGLLIPYAVLLFFARRQASFSGELSGARYASLPIHVGQEGLVSIGDRPVSDYSFIYMNPGTVQRTVETAGVVHEVRPPKAWPFAPISCQVIGSADSLVVSNLSGDLAQVGRAAPSSQALPDVFVAQFDRPKTAEQPPATGTGGWLEDSAQAFSGMAEADDGALTGQLILILPASSDPIQAAERALAKVRVWPRWTEVYSAVRGMTPASPVLGESARTTAQEPPAPNDPLSDW